MKYKLIALLAVSVVLTIHVFGQSKVPPAEAIIKEAETDAARTNKNVFVIFHASWCGWCHKMDSAMNDEKVKSFFDKSYVVVHLTVDESKDKKELENAGAVEIRKKYHGDQQGLPYWFILDARGNFLVDALLKSNGHPKGVSIGCPATNDEVAYFIKMLKKTSALNNEQLALIQERFLKNSE